MSHHYQAYGGWSWVMKDYWEQNFTQYINQPELDKLAAVDDPISKCLFFSKTLACYETTCLSHINFLYGNTTYNISQTPYPKRYSLNMITQILVKITEIGHV